MFMLDDSGSVNDEDFDKTVNFVMNVTMSEKITLDKSYVRIGLAAFSSKAKWMAPYKFMHEKVKILTELHKYTRQKEETNTIGALEFVRDEMLFEARDDFTKKFLIFMTDGKSQLDTEPQDYNTIKSVARDIKNKDAVIYTIGVGKDVSEKELFAISSGETPRKKEKFYMFNVEDFDQLTPVLRSIEDQLCTPSYWLAAVPILLLVGFILTKFYLDYREAKKFAFEEGNLRNSLAGKRWESGFGQKR